MASNGRLPASDLAPIAGGRLRKDAAAAWNAMNAESRRRFGVTLLPLGPQSSYRTLPEQEWLWDHVLHAHDPNWVAKPGTSNHGWGLAVDLATPQMRRIVDQIGAKYGWAKRWSDAPVEWWHLRWKAGVWSPPASDPLWFLTAEEKSKVREYQKLKELKASKARRGQLWRWFIERRKNIYRAAQHGGWGHYERRRRYAYFYRLTRS
jgi:hypothetical protein